MLNPNDAWLPRTVRCGIGEVIAKEGPCLGLVSPDDSRLTHSGGASSEIWRVGTEPALTQWAAELPLPLHLGSVVSCHFGPPGSKWLFHAVTLDIDHGRRLRPADCGTLFDALERSIRAAVEKMPSVSRRVAMPLLGTGVVGLPARVIVSEIIELAKRLRDIRVQLVIASPDRSDEIQTLIDEAAFDGLTGESTPSPVEPHEEQEKPVPTPDASGSPQGATGTAHTHCSKHVDKLAVLLTKRPPAVQQGLAQSLRESGYRGELHLQLREYCTREDPVEILTNLGLLELKSILASRSLPPAPPSEPIDAIARRILQDLGFFLPQPIRGLEFTRAELLKLQSQLPSIQTAQISAVVLAGSSHLERAIGDFLRFLCLHCFSHGPEVHFQPKLGKVGDDAFKKATLGTRLECLKSLAAELAATIGANGKTKWHMQVLGGAELPARLIVPDLDELPQIRNLFAHGGAPSTPKAQHELAARFFSTAIRLVEHWGAPGQRVYPRIIRIERITIDVWNRRIIEGVSSDQIHEYIITPINAIPGSTYFMHPLTNPLRVNPILIEFEEG